MNPRTGITLLANILLFMTYVQAILPVPETRAEKIAAQIQIKEAEIAQKTSEMAAMIDPQRQQCQNEITSLNNEIVICKKQLEILNKQEQQKLAAQKPVLETAVVNTSKKWGWTTILVVGLLSIIAVAGIGVAVYFGMKI